VNGELWQAVSEVPLLPGDRVIIQNVEGLTPKVNYWKDESGAVGVRTAVRSTNKATIPAMDSLGNGLMAYWLIKKFNWLIALSNSQKKV